MRVHFTALAVACLLVLGACAPLPAPPTPTPLIFAPTDAPAARSTVVKLPGNPGATLGLTGNFAYVGNDGNLTLLDAKTAESRTLVKTGTQGFAQFPAFSPDGKQVAYAYNAFTKDGFVRSEIHIINIDGSSDRTILAPTDTKITLAYPRWSADAKSLYVTQIAPVQPQGQHAEIDRVDIASGGLTKIIDNAVEASPSPDGNKIAYLQLDFATSASSLWIANIDGSAAKQLVDSATFLAMLGLRFSPDSQSVVFAASGPPQKKLPGVAQAPAREASDECGIPFLLSCAEANGLPWDLWISNVDATKFERVTNIGSDSPVPAWPSARYLAFFDVSGINVVDRETKIIYPISPVSGHGSFDWR